MFDKNLPQLALENGNFRKVINTTDLTQIVLMSLLPGEDIGMEHHTGLDQVLVIVSGEGQASIDGEVQVIGPGSVIVVPDEAEHNFINISDTEPMKLWTVYAPPQHEPGTIHRTKQDAEADEEHFEK